MEGLNRTILESQAIFVNINIRKMHKPSLGNYYFS